MLQTLFPRVMDGVWQAAEPQKAVSTAFLSHLIITICRWGVREQPGSRYGWPHEYPDQRPGATAYAPGAPAKRARGSDPMGRGRAKAKQTKVARDLKYRTHETDFGALAKELHGGDTGSREPDHSDDADDWPDGVHAQRD